MTIDSKVKMIRDGGKCRTQTHNGWGRTKPWSLKQPLHHNGPLKMNYLQIDCWFLLYPQKMIWMKLLSTQKNLQYDRQTYDKLYYKFRSVTMFITVNMTLSITFSLIKSNMIYFANWETVNSFHPSLCESAILRKHLLVYTADWLKTTSKAIKQPEVSNNLFKVRTQVTFF